MYRLITYKFQVYNSTIHHLYSITQSPYFKDHWGQLPIGLNPPCPISLWGHLEIIYLHTLTGEHHADLIFLMNMKSN